MFDLRVEIPDQRTEARAYIVRELLAHDRPVRLSFVPTSRPDTCISSADGRSLRVSDGLLGVAEANWLQRGAMPGAPVRLDCPQGFDPRDRVEPALPVLPTPDAAAAPGIEVGADGQSIRIQADLFGSAFFFLTRFEECAAPEADNFGRYPAQSSYAHRHGFLDRPVVDEYRALLDAALQRLWPEIPVAPSIFRIEVSHDVDLPLRYAWSNFARTLGGGLRDFARSRDVGPLLQRMSDWHAVRRRGQVERDPYNTFGPLMQHAERRGLRAAFYFIAERPAGNIDALYEIDDPFIADLIGRIHRAGHEVGLHGSFNTWRDAAQIRREFERLRRVCEQQGVRQDRWGGRQHYLRWQATDTWRHWQAAGLNYDATLGYPQYAGFRCGTSRPFRPYDVRTERMLDLEERPLVVMDMTLYGYMKFAEPNGARDHCLRLKQRCRQHGGVFSLLWHNSNLLDRASWQLYLDLLDA